MRVSPDRLFGLGAPVLDNTPLQKLKPLGPDRRRRRSVVSKDPMTPVRHSPHHRATDAALDTTLGASSRCRMTIGPWAKPVREEMPGWFKDGSQIELPKGTWAFPDAYACAKRNALMHQSQKRWAPGGEALKRAWSSPMLMRQTMPTRQSEHTFKPSATSSREHKPAVTLIKLKTNDNFDEHVSDKDSTSPKNQANDSPGSPKSPAPTRRSRMDDLPELPSTTRIKDLNFVRAWANVEEPSNFSEMQALELWPVFTRADDDGDLEVHKDELPSTVKVMGYLICNEEEISAIADGITNYSTVNFEQFLAFVRKYTEWERSQWQAHFDQFDADKSGEISAMELKGVLEGLGYAPMREMLQEALEMIDSDGSGQVSLDEFMKLIEIYRRTEGFTTQEYTDLQQLFTRFDGNKDGELTAEEQKYLLAYVGMEYVPDGPTMKEQPIAWKGFLAQMRRIRETEIRTMRNAFDKYDMDASGQIGITELPGVLTSMGMTPLKNMLEESIAMSMKIRAARSISRSLCT